MEDGYMHKRMQGNNLKTPIMTTFCNHSQHSSYSEAQVTMF